MELFIRLQIEELIFNYMKTTCCDAQMFGPRYHTMNCTVGIDELNEKKEADKLCTYCGKLPCKCLEINNQVDEFRDGSANFINY